MSSNSLLTARETSLLVRTKLNWDSKIVYVLRGVGENKK